MTVPRAFVIGHPIAHSRSPVLHKYWLKTYGLAGSYEAFDIAPDRLEPFIGTLRAGAFVGGNVTLPHKQAVRALCDEVAPLAAHIGAVNTLIMKDGRLIGENTDAVGFLQNLDTGAPGWDETKGPALILGAGGAARAVIAALVDRGITEIFVLNRTAQKAVALADAFKAPGLTIAGHGLDAFQTLVPRASLVVNAASVGLGGTMFEDLDFTHLPATAVVTDLVYVPLKTPFLAAAETRGCRTVDGLGMLLYQAVPGFAAWFGVTPEVTGELRRLILNDLAAK